jgi:dihydropyrimidine dehydrogenase (NADP+)
VSVDLLGLHFINPFGLSSATPTGSIGQIRRAFEMGWGFAVTKTVLVVPNTNISPRINGTPFPHHGASKEGFVNIELLTEKTSAYWVQGVQELKREHPKHIVIMSIMGGNQSEWEKLAHVANESKADAVELNLSCPHVGKKGYGMLAGQAPESVEEITGWVRRLTKLPLVVKLTPNVTDITAIAAAAKRGGADAVTAINTVGGLMSIAPTGKPQPSVGVECRSAYGGCSGNMIRPLAFKAVTAIRRAIPDMPILGTGGCDSAESGLQFIQAGASVIQITSSIQNQDYAIISELVNGLKALLYLRGRSDLADWHHQTPPVALDSKPASVLEPKVPRPQLPVPTVASLLGITAKEIAVVPELDLQHQVIAKVDEDLCLRCGKCYLSCNDTGYHAIEFDPKTHIPRITTDCMGCGLCGSVCPASCISYVRKDFPHKPCRGIPDPSLKLPFDQ